MDTAQTLAEILPFIVAPVILFILFVLPIWLFLHYRERAIKVQPPPSVTALNPDAMQELFRLAQRLENRIDAIEQLSASEKSPRKSIV